MPDGRGPLDLDQLLARLNLDQRRVLTAIWRRHLDRWANPAGCWITDRLLYFEFENRKRFVLGILHAFPVSGSVVFEPGYGSP